MIKIINSLDPFFNDCYRRINVREYAKLQNISPPTAANILNEYTKEGLLLKEKERQYHFFLANKENWIFRDLCRIYWKRQLERSNFLNQIEREYKCATIILFGSLAKAEVSKNADIDIAIFSPSSEKGEYSAFESKIKRKIQIFKYANAEEIKSKELKKNILSGYILTGAWHGLD